MNNKYILVSGATSGIGLAVVMKLLSDKINVIALGRNKEALKEIFSKYSDQILFIDIDLNNVKEIEQVIINEIKKIPKLDGMVLCAGREETIPLKIYKPNISLELFKINVLANIELIRLFSKKKLSNDFSSIVVVSSVMSILGQPGKVGYCSSKSALLGLVKSSALELSNRNIRVNAISPGVVKTKMTESLFSQLSQSNVSDIINMHPLGIGDVNDIVPLVDFLLSNDSKWITGQNIIVDGGYSIK